MANIHGEARYHAAIKREIGGNARVMEIRGGSVLQVTCTGGKKRAAHPAEYEMGSHYPPERLNRLMTQKGWRIGKRITCPECMEKEKVMPSVTAPPHPPLVPPPPPSLKPIQGEQSDAAKKATRLCFTALEDAYDDAKKAYRPGHSDKSIADELGMAQAAVAKVREEYFGPLAEPDEIVGARRDLADLLVSISNIEAGSALEIKELKRRAAAIEGQLATAARLNGWRV